jgi:hypothetical protein
MYPLPFLRFIKGCPPALPEAGAPRGRTPYPSTTTKDQTHAIQESRINTMGNRSPVACGKAVLTMQVTHCAIFDKK